MPVAVCCTAGEVLPQRRRPSTLCRAARAPRPCCHAPASPSPFLVLEEMHPYLLDPGLQTIRLEQHSKQSNTITLLFLFPYPTIQKKVRSKELIRPYKNYKIVGYVIGLELCGLQLCLIDKWGKMMTSSQLEHVKTILALGCLHLRLTGMFISCFRCLWVDFH
uniref:Uncharacterized protein n=1 Tax=Oryza glumipatula TaxID=40148 RepID=A0A0D9ZI87_9ORYZ